MPPWPAWSIWGRRVRRPAPAHIAARAVLRVAALALVIGCTGGLPPRPPNGPQPPGPDLTRAMAADDLYIGLSFSGGGHRASAFAQGVLQELAATGARQNRYGLAGHVQFLSGVSGGAVTATWFALTGPQGLPDFRDRYLLQDAGRYFPGGDDARTSANAVKARASLGPVLDELLFKGARFATLDADGPVLRIVASDLARSVPFVFAPATFASLCADLSRLPLSVAVASSAALPGVFQPVRIATHRGACAPQADAARAAAGSTALVRKLLDADSTYGDARVRSVQLVDGGATDQIGIAGFIAARLTGAPYAPMTPRQAMRVRHILMLGVDASRDKRRWSPALRSAALGLMGAPQRRRDGGGTMLDLGLTVRAVRATTTDRSDTLNSAVGQWRDAIVAWRCGLDRATASRLYGGPLPRNWNCRDLTVFTGQVSPSLLPDALRTGVNDIPTRLSLPPEQIDLAIAGGHQALRRTPAFANLIARLQAGH